MSYGIIHFFAGGSKDQYEATLQAVHPDRNSLPKGQLYHAAGATPGGWTVMAVHDSKATWEKFKNDTLMPKLASGIKGGFSGPPQETVFECYEFRQTSMGRSEPPPREMNL